MPPNRIILYFDNRFFDQTDGITARTYSSQCVHVCHSQKELAIFLQIHPKQIKETFGQFLTELPRFLLKVAFASENNQDVITHKSLLNIHHQSSKSYITAPSICAQSC